VCQGFSARVKYPWARIDSFALSASDPFLFNTPLTESALEAMRAQGVRKTLTYLSTDALHSGIAA